MFGIGTFELVIIVLIGFIILGPKKLPEIVKAIGKGIREFRQSLLERNPEEISEIPKKHKKNTEKEST